MWAELVYYAYRLGQTWFAENSVHLLFSSIDRDSLENKISCLLFKTRRKKLEQERGDKCHPHRIISTEGVEWNGSSPRINSAEGPSSPSTPARQLLSGRKLRSCLLFPTFSINWIKSDSRAHICTCGNTQKGKIIQINRLCAALNFRTLETLSWKVTNNHFILHFQREKWRNGKVKWFL